MITELASVGRGDPWGAARATAIVYGLGMTTLGYLVGRLTSRLGPSGPPDTDTLEVMPIFEQRRVAEDGTRAPRPLEPPVKTLDFEVTDPVSRLDDRRPGDDRYRQALALVRHRGTPIGSLEVAIPAGGLSGDELGAKARLVFADRITALERAELVDPASAQRTANGPTIPLSVVVPTRDRPEQVGTCIASLLATGYPFAEIVVVDNAPTSDDTARLLAERFSGRPEIRYLREETPGTSRARNRGWRATSSDIVAFLDDDLFIDREWASAIVRPFVDDERVGCATGLVIAAELETRAQVLMEEYGGFAKGYAPRVFDVNAPRSRRDLFPFAAGAFGTGASMAFRRSVLDRVGGFDPALGGGTWALGGEDLAAFVDVLLDGWRLAYEPRAIVRHFHRRRMRDLQRQLFGYGCGLSAYLTRTAVRHPGQLASMVRRTIPGLGRLLDPRSPKNARKGRDYPTRLTLLELAGFAWGPFAYACSQAVPTRPVRARHGADGQPAVSGDEPR
jgi:glycosyltransferase involved in cell wall biosynthesis